FRPFTHPPMIKARILCTECHNDPGENISRPYEFFNHTSGFLTYHKIYSVQEQETCEICHEQNFCADCHASKDITIPNLKNGERPDKIYPHKGDYIIRHRVNGKIFADKCFSCHGTKNNKLCKTCHK
ncbi:cytochrome C, partial [Candidatus Desantisbacteria bacterium]|nr:cytochrome C [Candidatus Desantisbacteria bacterium]